VHRRLLAPALLAACFTGDALEGEPCKTDADCGPDLACSDGGLCGEFRCEEPEQLSLENFAPDVLLLVDFAGTMRLEEVDGVPYPLRWDLAHPLLVRIADEVGPAVNLGMQVVPSVDPTAMFSSDPCFTSNATLISPAAGNGPTVRGALRDLPANTGEHALSRGLEFVLAALALRPGAAVRPQAIVVISDGSFNCIPTVSDEVDRVELFDAGLATRVAQLADDEDHPIPVYVVGVDVVPGGVAPAEGRRIFEVDGDLAFAQLAEAGGRPRPGATPYYTPADADELIDALREIPDAFADCRVRLDPIPDYPSRLVVGVAGSTFNPSDDCASGHGWRYADPDSTHIELCESTCEAFRKARALTIDRRCPSA